ncbi:hypothetical protein PQR66_24205 [Paraburkholderia agricolaris]|uniref:Uncharacterized protein n=1 Tax=Paraburkholderia agricolaris TaxID=2152888 RepID=A0ABW8ZTK0_9BURK
MSTRAVELSLYKHSGLTDLLRSTKALTRNTSLTSRINPLPRRVALPEAEIQ